MKIYEDYFSDNQEFLQAIINWGTLRNPGERKSESKRLQYRQEALGLNESVTSEGGWLVGADYARDILKVIFGASQLAKHCSQYHIKPKGPNRVNMPTPDHQSRADGLSAGRPIQAYWKCEASEKLTSKPRFRNMQMDLKKLIAMIVMTDELKNDVPLLEAYLRDEGGAEMGFKLDEGIIRGSGAGMPLGILNCGCLITEDKAAAQEADTIVLANFGDMFSRLWGPAKTRLRDVKWIINEELDQLIWGLAEGSNIFAMPGSNGYQGPSVLGCEILWSEHASILGDLGDIILADMKAYQIVDKAGPKGNMSMHLGLTDPTHGFVTDESYFRIVYRCDGQCRQHRPITPIRGSRTVGPFVTLEART